MAYTDFPSQNQLQFNLNVPLKTKNLAIQHHRLQPVVIQKTRDSHRTFNGPPNVLTSPQSFQFKSVSEERMAMAIQMAKRDLKNKKVEGKSVLRNRSPSPNPISSKTKVIHSKVHLDRQRKLQQKSKRPVSNREQDKNKHARPVKSHVSGFDTAQSPRPFNTRVDSRLPGRVTNSRLV